MSIAFLTALAVAAQAAAPAPIVTGQVVDPDNLPVARAVVRVVCGALASSVETDAHGRFELGAPGAAPGCLVQVRRDGFVSWAQPLSASGPIRARLALATYRETLTVRGSAGTPVRPASGAADGDWLRLITNSPGGMLEMARAIAGAGQEDQRVYVDGAPRAVLPGAERVGRVSINPDPYSAAFGDLDGARLEIETAPLAPAWRYTINASPGSLSAAHPLGAGHQWKTTSIAAGVSGPLPGTSLAWSAGVRRVRRDQESPLLSSPVDGVGFAVAESREELDGVSAGASYQRGTTRVAADVNVQDDRAFASGAGALVLPDAASNLVSRIVEMNASMRGQAGGLTLTSNGIVRFTRRSTTANSDGQGFAAAGSVAGGGSAVLADKTRSSFAWWSGRVSGLVRGRPWRAGATVTTSAADDAWTPNPLGIVERAADGSRTLFAQIENGSGSARHAETAVATYGEIRLVGTDRWVMTSGLRVDARGVSGATASPRISGSVNVSGTSVVFGAGQFVEELDAASLLPLYARADGGTTHLALAGDATLLGTTRVSIAPRRQRLASIGASRSLGAAEIAGEYRRSRIENAPSLGREMTPSGWNELFGSSARRREDVARVRTRLGRSGRLLVAYYTWRRAGDTADGWWGAAISPAGIEWAPAAGVASHEGGFLVSFKAPASIDAAIAGTMSSGRAMDVVFAPASLRDALQPPLRPQARNSALGPSSASVQVFAARPVQIQALRLRGRIGAQVTNLLGRRNLLAPVNVLGSPFYGRATDAGAARSVSIWFALGE